MASQVGERPPAASPDPWAAAPVAVGRRRRRIGWGLLVLALIAAGAVALLRTRPVVREPAAARSIPFDVTVVANVASMDNDRLFGRSTAIPDRAVRTATQGVDQALTRYLDAEFVDAATRFSDDPLAGVLSRRALDVLSDDDRAGLGAVGISVRNVQAEPVAATARVLTSGSDVVTVTVRYEAHALVIADDGDTAPLRQRATMVFAPEDGEWRAEAVTAVLDLQVPAQEVAR